MKFAIRFKMGIIYYVAFRFGGVKDISRIDEESSRTNLISFSSSLRFGGERKGRLFIYDIQIPENSDVICISNSAFDNYGYHTYEIVFENGETCSKTAYDSVNRFMVPVNGHSFFSYRVVPGGSGGGECYDGRKDRDRVTPVTINLERIQTSVLSSPLATPPLVEKV